MKSARMRKQMSETLPTCRKRLRAWPAAVRAAAGQALRGF